MHGTRERVFERILDHPGVRVDELADALGITPAAVRRHLDHLRVDGLIEARPVKQATGRPFHAYHPTQEATGRMPPAYADLLARILGQIGAEPLGATVAAGVAATLAERHRGEVPHHARGEARVERVTKCLRSEGILESWRAEEDGFHLLNSCCPYPQAAELSPIPCEADRHAIGLLLGDDVEQIERIVDGSPVCEYLVRTGTGRASVSEAGDTVKAKGTA